MICEFKFCSISEYSIPIIILKINIRRTLLKIYKYVALQGNQGSIDYHGGGKYVKRIK
jgi:hypothetical protein